MCFEGGGGYFSDDGSVQSRLTYEKDWTYLQ